MENYKVLIVDDKPANLLLLEHHLKCLNLEIIKAESGAEALKHSEKNDFAVIILDVQMPGMDGFELASKLRASAHTRYVPVIFVTAMGRNDMFEYKGYESGAVDYLLKPVDAEILRSKVRIFMELYEQRKVIEKQKAELAQKVKELEKAMKEIKILQGIIPICVHCKKIRDDKGYWESVEKYIEERANVGFSHGICPDCLRKHFPEIASDILDENDDVKPQ